MGEKKAVDKRVHAVGGLDYVHVGPGRANNAWYNRFDLYVKIDEDLKPDELYLSLFFPFRARSVDVHACDAMGSHQTLERLVLSRLKHPDIVKTRNFTDPAPEDWKEFEGTKGTTLEDVHVGLVEELEEAVTPQREFGPPQRDDEPPCGEVVSDVSMEVLGRLRRASLNGEERKYSRKKPAGREPPITFYRKSQDGDPEVDERGRFAEVRLQFHRAFKPGELVHLVLVLRHVKAPGGPLAWRSEAPFYYYNDHVDVIGLRSDSRDWPYLRAGFVYVYCGFSSPTGIDCAPDSGFTIRRNRSLPWLRFHAMPHKRLRYSPLGLLDWIAHRGPHFIAGFHSMILLPHRSNIAEDRYIVSWTYLIVPWLGRLVLVIGALVTAIVAGIELGAQFP